MKIYQIFAVFPKERESGFTFIAHATFYVHRAKAEAEIDRLRGLDADRDPYHVPLRYEVQEHDLSEDEA